MDRRLLDEAKSVGLLILAPIILVLLIMLVTLIIYGWSIVVITTVREAWFHEDRWPEYALALLGVLSATFLAVSAIALALSLPQRQSIVDATGLKERYTEFNLVNRTAIREVAKLAIENDEYTGPTTFIAASDLALSKSMELDTFIASYKAGVLENFGGETGQLVARAFQLLGSSASVELQLQKCAFLACLEHTGAYFIRKSRGFHTKVGLGIIRKESEALCKKAVEELITLSVEKSRMNRKMMELARCVLMEASIERRTVRRWWRELNKEYITFREELSAYVEEVAAAQEAALNRVGEIWDVADGSFESRLKDLANCIVPQNK